MLRPFKNRMMPVLLFALLCLVLSSVLLACTGDDEPETAVQGPDPVEVRVGVQRGPASMGMASFITSAQNDETYNHFAFAIMPGWRDITEAVAEGTVDMAVVPVGVATSLYADTAGAISVVDVCSLGQIYVVTGDKNVEALDSLHDRKVLMTSMGEVADSATEFLLNRSLGEGGVQIEMVDTQSELVAKLSADPHALGILEEPYATAANLYDDDLFGRVDLAEQWTKHVPDGSQLVENVTIVRDEFADAHPEAVLEFVEGQAQATQDLIDDPTVYAQEAYDLGFVDSLELAECLVPRANLVCMRGEDMHTALAPFIATVYAQSEIYDEALLPDDAFYRYV